MSYCTQTQPNCEEAPEYEFSKNETVDTDCNGCRETFSLTPDGGWIEGGEEGWLVWYAYDAECPNCGEVFNYGECY